MSRTTFQLPAPPTSPDAMDQGSRATKILASVGSKIMWMLVGAILFSPITPAVGIYIEHHGWLDFLNPPTIHEQLEAIRQTAAEDRRSFVALEHLRLHDSTTSYMVVLADAGGPFEETPDRRSDEVRIYDAVKDGLALRFRFLPEPRSSDDKFFTFPYVFRLDKAVDVDGDGLTEILGSYEETFADGSFRLPVLIGWDPAIGRYRMTSLLRLPPRLAVHGHLGLWGRAMQKFYRGVVHLSDVRSGVQYLSVPVEEYAWAQDRRAGMPVLLAVYVARADCNGCPHFLRVVPWMFRIAWPSPEVSRCGLYDYRYPPALPLAIRFGGGTMQQQVFRAWRDRPEGFSC